MAATAARSSDGELPTARNGPSDEPSHAPSQTPRTAPEATQSQVQPGTEPQLRSTRHRVTLTGWTSFDILDVATPTDYVTSDSSFPTALTKAFLNTHLDDRKPELAASRAYEKKAAIIVEGERPPSTFLARWTNPMRQNRRQWHLDQRIQMGKPYDKDTFSDPDSLKVSHQRYSRLPLDSRRSYPLAVSGRRDGGMKQGVLTCVSFMYQKHGNELKGEHFRSLSHAIIITGILVVDPLPSFEIQEIQYTNSLCSVLKVDNKRMVKSASELPCFCGTDLKSLTDRVLDEFLKRLPRQNNSTSCVIEAIQRMALDDVNTWITSLTQAVDEIDFSLAKENISDAPVSSWRSFLTTWRASLQCQTASLQYMQHAAREAATTSAFVVTNNVSNTRDAQLEAEAAEIMQKLDAMQSRINTTLQVLMSTLSIAESQKAIQQAAAVTKLTYLGFFFIPLSFVATLYGTNFSAFDESATWQAWVGTSFGALVVTYGVFFMRDITRNDPWMVENGQQAVREAITYLPGLAYALFLLGILAALGVALWKLYTGSRSKAAKIGISVAVLGPMILTSTYVAMRRYRRARRRLPDQNTLRLSLLIP